MSEACVGVKIFPMLSSARYDLRASGDPKRNAGANAQRRNVVLTRDVRRVSSHGGMPPLSHARWTPCQRLCFNTGTSCTRLYSFKGAHPQRSAPALKRQGLTHHTASKKNGLLEVTNQWSHQ